LPADPSVTSADVEQRHLEILELVLSSVNMPVAMKLSPYFSATANMMQRLDRAGVKGLALFNRFYQPDLEIEEQKVTPSLNLSLSTEMRLPLRWVGMMYGRLEADLAITTCVHTHEDVVKGLMAGAAVTMMASELLRNGISRIREIIFSLEAWLIEHDFNSVAELQGLLSRERLEDATAYERANYLEVLKSYAPAYMWRSGSLGLVKH
jgi:dihydroorotate dehydrogenase (fumarate)